MTSELRLLECIPICGSDSRTRTSRPDLANERAMARPTTPAPAMMQSSRSVMPLQSGLGARNASVDRYYDTCYETGGF